LGVKIVDSTTIKTSFEEKLFKSAIMLSKCPMMVPSLVLQSQAHDHKFRKLKCDEHLYIFDKGYNDYKVLPILPIKNTGFVTRIKDNAKYEVTQINLIPEHIHSSVLSDEIIEVEITNGTEKIKIKENKVL
jgi:hypothetical protein